MNNCNIIIPTYNRPAYLKRILHYYNDCKIGYQIIVADSSTYENKELNYRIIKQFPDLDILYTGKYPNSIEANRKIFQVLELIKTKYCVICGDDDFITPNGINQSADFLENNQDFSVVQGYYVAFRIQNKVEKELQFEWKYTDSNQSIVFPDSEDRTSYHLSNYAVTTFYGVHRTNLLKMIFSESLKYSDDFYFGELLLTMLTLIYGKLKCLNILFAVRDSPVTHMYSPHIKQESLADYIKVGTYQEKYARFVDCLSTHLSLQAQIDIEKSEEIINDAMSTYLKKYVFPNIKTPWTTKISMSMERLNLPGWLDEGIRKAYRRFTGENDPKWFPLDAAASSPYYEELTRISHLVFSSLQMKSVL
ncbi:TIGR00180 family glycosyltransferase [Chloroflexota bacterium]